MKPCNCLLRLEVFAVATWLFVVVRAQQTRHYKFDIQMTKVARLCHTKSIVTVNGRFPGPRIVAREGDHVVVRVVNHIKSNVTLHWHGVRQLRSGWSDGPAYITQCPIQTGQSYEYTFTLVGQRGTLLWHAHISWLRVTLYGPIIILPKYGVPYPFPKPYKEVLIIFGEWFNSDPEAIIAQALQTGGGPNISDAYTINGLPGPLYICSTQDTYKLKVRAAKTYLLRLINANLNDELFFSIGGHHVTVVEADAVYVKPFDTGTLHIGPGQTTNVILRTRPEPPPVAAFLMTASPYSTTTGPFDNSTAAAILQYHTISSSSSSSSHLPLLKPNLPSSNDTAFAISYAAKLRSLATAEFPANAPQAVDRRFFFTVGVGTLPCDANRTCQGPNGGKLAGAVNNISFVMPAAAMLEAHYAGQARSVFTADFPAMPTAPLNYTGTPPNNTNVSSGTRVEALPFGAAVEVVMQDTSILGGESHPLHLHGYNFFVVGQGIGNFDPARDPARFNLVDPMERNTVGVPPLGWVAIRFRADNPGVWLMHCHLEVHTSWGLKMAWLVLDGEGSDQKLPPPPSDLPKC